MRLAKYVPLAAFAFIAWSFHASHSPHPALASQFGASSQSFGSARADQLAIELVEPSAATDAVRSAQTVTISAFSLSPRGRMIRALTSAARQGAHVSVVLDGQAFGGAKQMNDESGPMLQSAGVRLRMTQNPLHMKALVVNGNQVFLSDRNWTSDQSSLMIHDEVPGDRMVVERAILGVPSGNDHLWTRKADALRAESTIIKAAHPPAIFAQSESFGADNPVYNALAEQAHAGARVYLIVSSNEYRTDPREDAALRELAVDGVNVRVGDTTEKFAINGTRVWIGSANATAGLPDQIDFGLIAHGNALALSLLNHFKANWDNAQAI